MKRENAGDRIPSACVVRSSFSASALDAPARRTAWRRCAGALQAAGVLMISLLGWAGQLSLSAQTVGGISDLAPGRFLVASRDLPDPNFAQTVVLLIRYDTQGAMGLVINRRSDIPLSRLFRDLPGARQRTDTAFLGGPVARGGLMALVRSRTALEGAGKIFDEVHLVNSRELLEKGIAAGQASDKLRVYLGYSGWAPGQLEREIQMQTWHIFDASSAMVFATDPESVWPRMIRRTETQVADARLWRLLR